MSTTDIDSGRDDPTDRGSPPSRGRSESRDLEDHRLKDPPAVLCDFDDTTVVENVAELLLDHFSQDGVWRELRRQSQDRSITFREYQEQAFKGIGASLEDMKAVVRDRATLRPYFKELWTYCRARAIPLAIVTVGLDFYVDALLEREGMEEIPRYAVKTSFSHNGISFEYPHPWDGSGGSTMEVCSSWGNSKCSVLGKYRGMGHSIIYVGDGRSDYCPASIADRVYARGPLVRLCRENGIRFTEFQDFRELLRDLEDWPGQSVGFIPDSSQQGDAY